MKYKNILITGGAGYIGSVLTGLLLKNGYYVTILDSLRVGGTSLIPFFSDKKFSFIKGDIRNKKDVVKSLQHIDAVIHLAGIVGFPACKKDPIGSFDINVNGTKTLLASLKASVPIFFASSTSVYGKVTKDLCTEKTPVNPLSEYGEQKTLGENIIKKHENFIIFRFATAFGVSPHMRLDVMPNDFVYRAMKEKSLIVYERNFTRTFIHVYDMARVFLFGLTHYEHMKREIYNVGDNKLHCSKEELCHLIQKHIPYYLHFAEINKDLEERNYRVSYDKLATLGFHSSISLEEGIIGLVKIITVLDPL